MDLKIIIILVLFLGILASYFEIKYLKRKIKSQERELKVLEYYDSIKSDRHN